MKTGKIIILLIGLAALTAITGSCKRNDISDPSPYGPSTVAAIFKLNTNQNALAAGDPNFGATRGVTNITATLLKYDGSPVANKSVFFEITDTAGTPVNIGYFEGGGSVKSAATNSSGAISINYYGPLAPEIDTDTEILIKATVGWQGQQPMGDYLPLYLIRDFKTAAISWLISPDVLYADANKPRATVMAQLIYGGVPLQGVKIYFMIKEGLGYFDDNLRATYRTTDSSGTASLTYIGPNMNEIAGDVSVFFRIQLTENQYWQGADKGPDGIVPKDEHGNDQYESLSLRVIRKR